MEQVTSGTGQGAFASVLLWSWYLCANCGTPIHRISLVNDYDICLFIVSVCRSRWRAKPPLLLAEVMGKLCLGGIAEEGVILFPVPSVKRL
jgi:hypothetical protein